MAINFELYKVFMAAATNRSFSKAAEELFVTQSAVSQSVSKLEAELGKELFERSKTGLKLTADGKFLLETISASYNILMSAENKVKNSNIKNKQSQLKIACSPIIFKRLVFPILSTCLNNDVNIYANSLVSDKDKIFFVKEDLADFALIKDYGIPVDIDLICKVVFKLNYVFFYNPKFFNIKDVDDIVNYPLILKASDTKGRKDFDKLYSNISNNCKNKIEVSHDELVIDAAESGLGVGFAPIEYISRDMKIIKPDIILTKNIFLVCKQITPLIKQLLDKLSVVK